MYTSILLYLISIIELSIIFLFSMVLQSNTEIVLYTAETIFVIFMFILLLRSFYRNGIMSLYSIFLFTSFFFLFDRIILHIAGYSNYLHITFPGQYICSEKTGIVFIIVSTISYIIIDIGVYSKKKLIRERNYNFPKLYNNIIFICMLLVFPFLLIKLYYTFKYMQSVGYIYYTLHQNEINLPFFIENSGIIFQVLFFFFIMTEPLGRRLSISLILYALQALASSLKGNRAEFGVCLIFVIFYYYKTRKKDIRLKTIFIISILFILFYFVASANRGNKVIFNSLGELILTMIDEQAVSITLPLFHIEKYFEISKPLHLPFIISDYTKFNFQTSFLSQKIITHMLGSELEKQGFGLGYCFLSELIDMGIFMLPCCYYFGKFISFVDINITRNTFLIPFFGLSVMSIVYTPRHMMLQMFSVPYLLRMIGVLLVYLIMKIFIKRCDR